MRFPSILALLTTTVIAGSAACSSDPATTPRSSSSSGATAASAKFGTDVMAIIASSCALTACHGSNESHLGILLTTDTAQAYAELQKSSTTYNGAKYVVAGKPDESFVIAKIQGKQGSFPGCNGGCGQQMPQDNPLADSDVAVFVTWVTNGAKND